MRARCSSCFWHHSPIYLSWALRLVIGSIQEDMESISKVVPFHLDSAHEALHEHEGLLMGRDGPGFGLSNPVLNIGRACRGYPILALN